MITRLFVSLVPTHLLNPSSTLPRASFLLNVSLEDETRIFTAAGRDACNEASNSAPSGLMFGVALVIFVFHSPLFHCSNFL